MRLSNRIISIVLSAALVIGLVPMRPTYVLAEPDNAPTTEVVDEAPSADESETASGAVDEEAPTASETPQAQDTTATAPVEDTPAGDEPVSSADQELDEQVFPEEEAQQDESIVEETQPSLDDDAPEYDPTMSGEDAPRLKSKRVLRSSSASVPETHTKQEIIDYINAHPFDLDSADTYVTEPSVSSFVVGDLSEESRQNALNALNTFRYIAGIGSDIMLDDTYNYNAQVASLVNAANGYISHYPKKPEGMDDGLYTIGYNASSRSNLASGQNNAADAIYAYFGDDGDNNHNVVGHRQWVLSSQLGTVGIGQVGKFNTTYVFDGGSSGVETEDVAWPARLMPTTFFGVSYQWSFSTQLSELGSKGSITVHVERQRDGKEWDLTSGDNMAVTSTSYGYDNNSCIVWDMPDVGSYLDGDVFDVTIMGDAGEKSYQVEFFDLYMPDKLTIMNGAGTTYENGDSIAVSASLGTMSLFFLPCYQEETLAALTEAQQSLAWAAADEIVISYSSSDESVATTSIKSPHTNSIYSGFLGRWYSGDRRCTVTFIGTGTTEITATFSNGTTASVTLDVSGRSITDSKAQIYKYSATPTYDGTAKEYVSRILYDGETLTKDVDYTLEYQNNVNAGTKTALVIVRGIGEYTGVKSLSFSINPASITSTAMASIPTQDHTGSPIEPPLTLTYKGMTLEAGTDYEVSYENNVNAGTATAAVTGKGNYTGTTTASFAITKTLSNQDIQPIEDVLWDGASSVTVTPVVTDGEKTLVSGTDYVLRGTNSFNAIGAASIIVEGMGSYTGTATASFTIYGDLSKATVAIIPAQTYSGAQLTPQPTVTFAGTTLTKGVDYEVSYESNVNAGTATATITGIGNYQGTTSKTFNICRASISSATISSIAAQTYTGEGLIPTPTVKLGSTTLALNTDYTLSYENNVNAGTATVTVTGTGNFDGTKSTTFTIRPKTLTAQNVEAIQDVLWNGSSIVEVTPVVKDGSKALVSGTDYAINSYLNNNCVGSASVTLEGKGNYTSSVTAPFTIYGDLSRAVIADVPTQVHTGSALEPQLRVTFAGTLLTAGTDYMATYSNNVEVGEASVALAGTGHYQGNASTTFQIVENVIDLSSAKVTAANQTYTGLAQKPAVTVTLDGKQLVENVDYEVTYSGNVNVGTATVTVAGKGGYAGFATGTFTIAPASISSATVSTIAAQTYTGEALEPKPTVKVGVTTLTEGVDYDLSYKNNVKVGTATVTVTGKGNYTGTATGTFAIVPADISGATVSTIAAQIYTGKALTPKPTVTVGETALAEGVDYTLSYANNTNAGTATVTVTGRGNYAGTRAATFRINGAPISRATVSAIAAQAYTGKAVTPRPTVKYGATTLKAGTDYVLSYKNNVKAGTATVTVTGRGNYAGTRSVTFRIVAPSVSYRTHVQNVGWQAYVKDGAMSGTSGMAYRLEGINIKLSSKPVTGGITYRTHVQNIGWQAWRKDGAMSGTSGQALRLEAIQVKLTGEMAKRYDVYYRVHCENIGWMGWAKNGQQSGSAGYGYRLEGIQVVIVPKGAKAPANTYKGIKANTTQAFRQR